MEVRTNICGLTRSDLEHMMTGLGEKPFRGRQIYKWMYSGRVTDFENMTDVHKNLRSALKKRFTICPPKITGRQKSADGTEKFLFAGVGDRNSGSDESKNLFEAVLIDDENANRTTLCISSQIGCPLGCLFCATGQAGFERDLTVGEIIGQPLAVRQIYGESAFDNLVFMGMGEPLMNFDNVMTAVNIMTDSLGLMLGARRITISTAGFIPGIRRLAASGSKVNLALSLNAADDTLRSQLMPIARSYPLAEVLDAVRQWTSVRKRRVTFEYVLLEGVNDGETDALALANLVRGIPCKINLLAYNEIDEDAFRRPSEEAVNRFAKILYPRTPAVTVRKSRGADIMAACGQLAGKEEYQ